MTDANRAAVVRAYRHLLRAYVVMLICFAVLLATYDTHIPRAFAVMIGICAWAVCLDKVFKLFHWRGRDLAGWVNVVLMIVPLVCLVQIPVLLWWFADRHLDVAGSAPR